MGGHKPFFSVVIPTLNEERLLPKLLTSLSRQLDKDFEVIVVDGKSEDRTVKKTEEFVKKLPELKVVLSDRRNVCFQRNKGAAAAKGKFLVFFDADVTLPANFLSQIDYYLKENKKVKFLTTWLKTDSHSEKDKLLALFYSVYLEVAKSLGKPLAPGFCVVVDEKVFKTSEGFNEKLKIVDDHEFSMRLHSKGIDLTILKSPRIVFSLRRFRREGTLNAIRKYVGVTMEVFTNGPFSERIFRYEYPQGGKVGTVRRPNGLEKTLKRYHRILKEVAARL